MTAGIWLAILGLTIILATVAHRRALDGKPHAWYALIGLCVASGIWHTATNGVGSWPWMLSTVGLMSGLAALVMFATRRSR
jgi:uncharacterized membrane protein YhaH (DUF805 family)